MSSESVNISQPQSLISRKYLIISILLSLATMAGVIYWTYTPGVLEFLSKSRLPGLIIALVVSLLRVWFSAAKIRFLSEKKLDWYASVRVVLAWDFTSAVTPSTIGGAPMATYAMTKEGLKLGDSGAIILYGVLLDQIWFALAIPILLVSGIFYEVVPPEIGLVGDVSMGLLYVGLLSYAGLLAYGVLVNPTAIKRVVKFVFKLPVLRRMGDKVEEEAENLEEYAQQLGQKPLSFLLKAFFLSTMSWLARIALPTIVVLSLLPAPEVLSVLRSLAMNLAFLVVPTPGGSGGVEGLFVLFQGPLISREGFIGLAVFLWRIISYYISIGLGMMATTWYVNQKVVEIKAQD
ncbi:MULTISPECIES: lysylphosphatidylglycerol synthase transmembrane domain-containing protein [Gracilimonas]|uniref:Flippase-like domain-containing protein n=1 Tax=Gracilimonas sediminicola TaxID=2952158 RepID=A0A9X2RHE2_9BACT|nr:lysylphosphatidylglycerol synthase transmembrane domain-containing protein [Gracilimonas sediminicola]MCP9292228.1 flippase-like domain-containing protein [Gracilimonas sediminicola]